MADVKENQMKKKIAENLRCLDSAGNSGIVRNIQNTISLQTTTVDCNEMKDEGRYSAYKWKNSPYPSIGILEVFCYSNDWIVQKMYGIESESSMYIRSFYNGNTWSDWKKII